MRVAGDNHTLRLVRKFDEGSDDRGERSVEHCAGMFKPKTHVGGHLVVAAAGRMQLGRGRNGLGQRLLDVHVHIFERGIPVECARLDLGTYDIQARLDRVALLGSKDADVGEHRSLRLATLDIKGGKPLIKRYGFTDAEHQIGRAFGEASTPRCLFFSICHS